MHCVGQDTPVAEAEDFLLNNVLQTVQCSFIFGTHSGATECSQVVFTKQSVGLKHRIQRNKFS